MGSWWRLPSPALVFTQRAQRGAAGTTDTFSQTHESPWWVTPSIRATLHLKQHLKLQVIIISGAPIPLYFFSFFYRTQRVQVLDFQYSLTLILSIYSMALEMIELLFPSFFHPSSSACFSLQCSNKFNKMFICMNMQSTSLRYCFFLMAPLSKGVPQGSVLGSSPRQPPSPPPLVKPWSSWSSNLLLCWWRPTIHLN